MGRTTEPKCLQLEELCAKSAKIKKLCAKDVKIANTLAANSATFTNMTSETATIKNLNVTTINGASLDSFTEIASILPVVYQNGLPQQPPTPTINQDLANVLWGFALIEQLFVTTNAASGRMRNQILNAFYGCTTCPPYDLSNCGCPTPGYAVFQGSVSGNVLTVTSLNTVSLTNCPPAQGVIEIGQRLFTQTNALLEATIVSQETGTTGGVGTYTIQNSYDDYSKSYTGQLMSLANLTQNDCIKTPLRIYGSEITSLTRPDTDGRLSVMSNISYNLNIANRSLSSKIAAVYVQVGWLDGLGDVEIRGIEVDTSQYDPSILSYGELLNNTVFLPTDLVNAIAPYNLFSDVANAAIQLIVYVEEGLEVIQPLTGPFSSQERVPRSVAAKTVATKTTKAARPMNKNISARTANNRNVSAREATTTSRRIPGEYTTTFDPNRFLPQETITIPEGTTQITLEASGAGGGGGIGFADPNNGFVLTGGGGGGSGIYGKKIIDNINRNYKTVQIAVGRGGGPNQPGAPTIVVFREADNSIGEKLTFQGGRAGQPGGAGAAGDGGLGYYGGGGGSAPLGSSQGFGGEGRATVGCPNGEPGNPNGQEGRGGSPTCNGARGGTSLQLAGGGGGGVGAGVGQTYDVTSPDFAPDAALSNAQASSGAGGGGGVGYQKMPAGFGGEGYYKISFSQ